MGKEEAERKARAEAERTLQMSEDMGYYWGQVDAREVLEVIGRGWRLVIRNWMVC